MPALMSDAAFPAAACRERRTFPEPLGELLLQSAFLLNTSFAC
jgi:hypothetical protein